MHCIVNISMDTQYFSIDICMNINIHNIVFVEKFRIVLQAIVTASVTIIYCTFLNLALKSLHLDSQRVAKQFPE